MTEIDSQAPRYSSKETNDLHGQKARELSSNKLQVVSYLQTSCAGILALSVSVILSRPITPLEILLLLSVFAGSFGLYAGFRVMIFHHIFVRHQLADFHIDKKYEVGSDEWWNKKDELYASVAKILKRTFFFDAQIIGLAVSCFFFLSWLILIFIFALTSDF